MSVRARPTRGWRPDPLSDSDVVDLAEAGATRWETTPAQARTERPLRGSRGAVAVSVWNLAVMDVGMMCLFVLFRFPAAAGNSPSAPRGSWADLSALGYYLGEFVDLAASAKTVAIANPLPLLAFALIMALQLVSVGLLNPSGGRSLGGR